MKKTKIALLSVLSLLMLAGCGGNSSSAAPSSETPISQVVKDSSSPSSSLTPTSSTPVSSSKDSSAPASSTSGTYDTDWSEELVDEMLADLNYVLPYVNLGKDIDFVYTPGSSYGSDVGYLDISGDYSYSDIKEEAAKAFEADGWSVKYDDTSFIATKEENHLTVEIFEDEDMGCANIRASYDAPFDPTSITAWSQADLDLLNTYMDNHEIPFFYMGTTNPNLYWASYNLEMEISGGKYDETMLSLAQTNLEAAGWTCSLEKVPVDEYNFQSGSDYLVATKSFDDGCLITICLGQSYYGLPYCTISLSEEYNPTGYQWSAEVEDCLTKYFPKYKDEIPAIYVGAKNPFVEYSDWQQQLSISGPWNDKMWEDVKTTLENAGYTVKEEVDDWDNTVYVATKVMEDGNTVEIQFSKADWGDEDDIKAYVYISLKKAWDPTALTEWPENIQSDFSDYYFTDYTIPFIYLGTDEPTGEYQEWSSTYEITGGEWTDKVYAQAESALTQADGWSLEKDTSYVAGEEGYYIFTKDMGDGYEMEITIDESYNEKIVMTIRLIEKFDPTSATEWEESLKDEIADDFDKHEVPFVYMGKQEPNFDLNDGKLYIEGGVWYDEEISLFNAAFNSNSGWTVTSVTAGEDQWTFEQGSTIYVATKEFADGHILTVRFGQYTSSDTLAYMTISMEEKYDPTTFKGWSDDIKTDFKEYLNGNSLPEIYMGVAEPEGNYDSSKVYTIMGGTYREEIVEAITTGYEEDGWTVTKASDPDYEFDTNYDVYIMTKTFEDGTSVSVRFGVDYVTGKVMLKVSAELPLVIDENITDWPAAVTKGMSDFCGGHTIPYFWTNTATPTWNNDYYTFIEGGDWNEGLIPLASAAFEKDGWTVYVTAKEDTYTKYGSQLVATKTFDDGKCVIVTLYCDGSKTAFIDFKYKDAYTVDESVTNWGSVYDGFIQDKMRAQDIPYFYLGSKVSVSYNEYTDEVQVLGEFFDYGMFAAADSVYSEADGWSTQVLMDSNDKLVHQYTKTLDNGDVLKVTFGQDFSGYSSLVYQYIQKYVVDPSVTSWNDEAQAAFKQSCGEEVPFFYIGSEYTVNEVEEFFNGDSYFNMQSKLHYCDDLISEFTKAYTEEDGWVIETEYDSYDGYTIYKAIKQNDDGSKIMITLEQTSSGNIYISVYHYVASENP